jgi:hypothetical protein
LEAKLLSKSRLALSPQMGAERFAARSWLERLPPIWMHLLSR